MNDATNSQGPDQVAVFRSGDVIVVRARPRQDTTASTEDALLAALGRLMRVERITRAIPETGPKVVAALAVERAKRKARRGWRRCRGHNDREFRLPVADRAPASAPKPRPGTRGTCYRRRT